MRKYLISLFILSLGIIIFSSCGDDRADFSAEDQILDYQVFRFDHDILSSKFDHPEVLKQDLYQKYGDFAPAYLERIIRIGSSDSLKTYSDLELFTSDPFISALQNDIDSVFTEEIIQDIENNFTVAFKRIKYLFPELNEPDIVFYNSGFNNGIVTLENQIAIGLDFYIGNDNRFVKSLPPDQFQNYKREKMESQFLVADAVKYWLEIELEEYWIQDDLLSDLAYKGKIMYLMDVVFPEMEDHIKIRYFKDEIKWAEDNQYNIWLELAQDDVIYGTNSFEKKKWTIDAPYTNVGSIPQDSPPRLGEWVGWQMVLDYMDENKDCSVRQLIKETDKISILNSYDPR